MVHGKRRCFLGNGLAYKLFVQLLGQANQFVSYDQLRSEVWSNQIRTHGAIRSAAKVLRTKLRQAEMQDLAEAIDGSVPEHYSFRWPASS